MKPIEAFDGEYRFLSNFWPVDIVFEDYVFPSVEHAYQAAKTLSQIERQTIQRAKTASIAKRLGKSITLRADWEKIRVPIMRELLEKKFSNKELAAKLLATGDAQLIEGNYWNDYFWGVCNGKGENWLGRLLMKIRAHLEDCECES